MQALLTLIRVLAVVCLVCSVGLNFANVVGRYFFASSITWAEEGMLFLMVGCVFLGSGSVAWSGRHIHMDLLVRLLPAPARTALALLSELALMLTSAALVVFAWPTIRRLAAFDQRSLAAEIPLAIPQSLIPIGLALMALLVLCRLLTGRWRDPSHAPDV